jgi:hypothetical protein
MMQEYEVVDTVRADTLEVKDIIAEGTISKIAEHGDYVGVLVDEGQSTEFIAMFHYTDMVPVLAIVYDVVL